MTREEHHCEENTFRATIHVYKIGTSPHLEMEWYNGSHSVSIKYCPFCGVEL